MKRLNHRQVIHSIVTTFTIGLWSWGMMGDLVWAYDATDANLKVAFIGDSDKGEHFRKVLELIKYRGAHMVLHQGDLAYGRSKKFMKVVNKVLGPNFPYFASRGNHDWNWRDRYGAVLEERAKRVGAVCTGDYGQNSACKYRGLFFILSKAREKSEEDARYIQDELAADNSIWRICSWHYNQETMQIGDKSDQAGWGPYEACREGGAIIATAHEHSYERTRTLTSTENLTVDPDCNNPAGDAVCVARKDDTGDKPGSTFVFVSGLGGHKDIRNQTRCKPIKFPHGQENGCKGIWASIYSKSQDAKHGALFITFNVDGPNKAEGKFVNIDKEVIDSFAVTAK